MSMAIVKASRSKADGRMNFRMVASNTDVDLFNTQMSLELFSDFVRRIENKEDVPDPFKDVAVEDGWDGGMPYLSIAHYKSAGGKNVPGAFEKVYIDGDRLKALGYCFDTKMGNAVFQSLCDDLVGRSLYEHKIRASIGFLDLKHSHGDFVFERKSATDNCPMCVAGKSDKVFLAGQLVHIALTREPVNPGTDVTVEERSMDVKSKQEDASSILGDVAEELVITQSTVSDVVQVRSETDTVTGLAADPEPVVVPEAVVDAVTPAVTEAPVTTVVATPAAVTESPVDVAVRSLLGEVAKLKASPDKEAALVALQPSFNHVADVIRQEFSTPVDPMAQYSQQMSELNDRCSRIESALTALQASMAAMHTEDMTEMSVVAKPDKPARRQLVAPMISLSKYTTDQIGKDRQAGLDEQRVAQPALPGVAPKMQELANRSVYGK